MKTFKGGIHPKAMKYLTRDARLERIPPPRLVVLPVLQHIGVPAKAIVKPGDAVLKGQAVAEANGYVSVPVHASTSGTVKAVERRQTSTGQFCDHVVIESDGEERWAPGVGEARDWKAMGVERIKAAIRDAGVVGLGGAAFPTHVKLSPPEDRPIDLLIINGIECEPYLTADYRLMIERAKGIAEGIRIIMKVLGAPRAVIGVEADKRDAFEKMRDTVWADDAISAELLEVKYPQGAEKQLIESIAGREVPPGRLPFDVGVVVHNVGTACAVFEAVAHGVPLIERAVTVTGDGVARPANLVVPLGTPIGDILQRQGLDPRTRKVVLGGPMMGIAVPALDMPVVKGTSGILALRRMPNFMPGPCIRCGRCVEVCPLRGMAAEMVEAIEAGDVERYEHLHVLDCMECGTCTFECPAHRPIVHYVKKAKAEYAAWKAARARRQQEEGKT
jgi:electron transport complex protein RnfC